MLRVHDRASADVPLYQLHAWRISAAVPYGNKGYLSHDRPADSEISSYHGAWQYFAVMDHSRARNIEGEAQGVVDGGRV